MPVRLSLVCALTLALLPVAANAAPRARHHRTARAQASEVVAPRRTCLHSPVEVVDGAESVQLALVNCDGAPAPLAVERLSVLARSPSSPRPKQSPEALARVSGARLAPGVRRLDVGLVDRLAKVVDHFRGASGQAPRVVLVSGYRPRSAGSYHARGRALDFRLDGIDAPALVAFCKTLPDTGCGFYPNGSFVHLDVRDPGTGRVSWTDLSRPGEAPHYVAAHDDPPAPSLPNLPTQEQPDAKGERPSLAIDVQAHAL